MAENPVYIGLDGGGTKTVAVVLDQNKTILGQHSSGSTNVNSVGHDVAKANFHEAIENALSASGQTKEQVRCICLSMAGVDRSSDIERVQQWTSEILDASRTKILVYNDAVAAISSGTQGVLHGVVVISGTGMVVFGFNQDTKESQRAGGWGPVFNDIGSGHWIGTSILHAVASASDQNGPATALTDLVLRKLDLETPSDLIGWAYADLAWARVAALAPLAFQCYHTDHVARRIVNDAADELYKLILTVAHRMGFADQAEPFSLVFAGGILQNETMAAILREYVLRGLPHANILHQQVPPHVGSALVAIQYAD